MDENQDLAKQYQDILDRYSRELAAPTPPAPPAATPEPTPAPDALPQPAPTLQIEPTTPPLTFSTPVEPPAKSNLFKYLFFISLFIFLGVLISIIYTISKNSNPTNPLTPTPSETPTAAETTPIVTTDNVCSVNDKQFKIGESFLADDGCNTCSCGADLTIVCTLKACEATPSTKLVPTLKPTATPTINKSLYPADSQAPAAGICSDIQSGQLVTLIIPEDNVPQPRCQKVNSDQKLIVINNSKEDITLTKVALKTIVKSGSSYQFTKSFGQFLAPGVHSIGGAEIWLQ